ncbi:MAG: twin-arginine translocase subunit TatC [Planctomycetia bacterium]|jgi:sec-independent protein translocase protein TatC
MTREPDKDLFASSTMSLGEHLEELRGCLFRAIVGLVICAIIGLIPAVGSRIVRFIEYPLVKALGAHYEERASEKAEEQLETLRANGEVLPAESEVLVELIKEKHLLPRQVMIDPETLFLQLKKRYPERFKGVSLSDPNDNQVDQEKTPKDPEAQKQTQVEKIYDSLVPIYIWQATADDPRTNPKSFKSEESFIVYIKASLLFGFILASPWIFYQGWKFVGAGLYPHERRYIHLFLPMSLGLFLAGAALAFFFAFPYVLSFLLWFNQLLGIDMDARISDWLGFAMMLPLGFGISFQLPLVMLFLERIGVFSIKTYLSKIRMAILIIFIVAMFLTPSDPQSMFLMAVPLVFLYFGGILLCKYLPKHKSPFGDTEEEKK